MLPRSSANVRSGAQRRELRRGGAPSRCRSRAPVGSVVERRADERVARVGALGHRREHEAVGRVGRGQVLGRVHRDVGAPVEHRLLHLLHEHAGAADRVDRDVGARSPVVVTIDELGVAAEQRGDALAPATARARCHASRRGSGRGITSVGDRRRRAAEQLGQRVGVELAARRAGGVLHADRRLVQQLVDDACG